MWASDQLNGALVNLDWLELKNELNERREEWTNMFVEHASKEGKFFTVEEPFGAYLVPAKTYEALLEMIEDQDLGRIVRERVPKRSEAVEVSLAP